MKRSQDTACTVNKIPYTFLSQYTQVKEMLNIQSLLRGDKATSSVRLRKRRDDPPANQPGGGDQPVRRKNNHRHSGDFAFFSPSRNAAAPADRDSGASLGEDFNYITFPNGVPIVQEVRVGGAATPTSSPIRGGAQQAPHPIRVTMRDINIKASRAVSASVMNLHSSPPPPPLSSSTSFHNDENGGFNGRLHHNGAHDQRRPLHARSHSQQPKQHHHHHQLTQHHAPARSQQQQQQEVAVNRGQQQQARRNEKRCSSEFEFKRINRSSGDFSSLVEERTFMEHIISRELQNDTGSEASQESGIFSTGSSQESPRKEARGGQQQQAAAAAAAMMRPRPGLGRRAITQINLKERKNSYNSALARSQENLVQMGCGEEEPEEEEEEEGVDRGNSNMDRETTIKKGLLWQQRDKIFSRWKERYFILTKDFLQCFKKETSKITDMGGFIFKIKLSEVERVDLLDKRGYLTICITVVREGKVYLRNTEGIRDWYEAIRDHINKSKIRKSNRTSAIFADRKQNTDSCGMEAWVAQRRLGLSDSTPEVNKAGDSSKERITLAELSNLYRREEEEERIKEEEMRMRKKINRLSLMTDMDLPDLGAHSQLGLDLERGIFVRGSRVETDSGNNSLNTNRSNTSTGSSKLSQPMESSFLEEEEDQLRLRITDLSPVKPGDTSAPGGNPPDLTCHAASPQMRVISKASGGGGNNKNVIEVRYRERSRESMSPAVHQERRRSQHVNRLQITHV